MKRAERRHHKERVKQRAREKARHNYQWMDSDRLSEVEDKYAKISDNLKVCKHDCCKNVRSNRWEKDRLTKQEKSANMRLKEYRDEIS